MESSTHVRQITSLFPGLVNPPDMTKELCFAEDDLTCPVCFELLKDPNTPKLLDCPHVCCAVCIQKMIEGGRRIIDCPECRHVTRIPKKGVTAMKTILRVRSLAEKHEEHTKKAQATSPNQDPSKKTQTTAAMCPEHNVIIDFYCKKCNIVGCSSCMVYKHKGAKHEIDELQTIHHTQKGCMEALFNKANKEIEDGKQSVQELGVLQDEMKRSLKIQCESIEKQVKLALKRVEEEGETVKANLQKNEQRRIERVQQERNRLQIQIQEATDVVTTAKNTMERTAKHEYVVKHHQLTQTISSALDKDTKGQINRNPVIGMTRYVYDKSLNVIGNLGRTLQVWELKCELIQEFGEFQSVSKIAVTISGSLVVNDFTGKQVYIYSQQDNGQYTKQSSLSLLANAINGPYDVAVTTKGTFLVARWTHVEVYSASGKHKSILNFRQKDIKGNQSVCAFMITVMSDGRIVVADLVRSMLTILSQEETTLGTIRTSIEPCGMAEMPHGHIAVSNWLDGKVCKIDLKSGREVQTFDIPHARGLCYHEQTDCLLVGRCLKLDDSPLTLPKLGTGVIEQYCSTTGRLVACIAEGLCDPNYVIVTPDGMLAVADAKTVKVYKVSVNL